MSADTIFALSSGAVPSAVAVIRLSGPGVRFCLETILRGSVPEPRRAALRSVVSAEGDVIDTGLVLWLPGPGTFTGEDSAELQLHGSRAVVQAVARRLGAMAGLRPAEPGEFTRRAFLNGRLDLAAAEGLADLIAAETDIQRRAALGQLGGGFARLCEDWRQNLLMARAWIEAGLDFTDEGDVPTDVVHRAWDDIGGALAAISRALDEAVPAERVRSGFEVVLMGPPNAGKSTLMNALAGREVAIVHEEAGTTRDVLEVLLDLGGYPVRLVDTAGVRASGGAVEAIGIARGLARGRDADLVLWLDDGNLPDGTGLDELADVPVVRVRSKIDLDPGSGIGDEVVGFSARTGAGMEALLGLLRAAAAERLAGREDVMVLQERQRVGLAEAAVLLEAARTPGRPVELVAEDLRRAEAVLGRISGRGQPDEVLDRVFSQFCIGK